MTSKKVAKNLSFKIPRKELAITVGIYLLSFFINFYKMPQNLFFGHEQGRDTQAVKDIYTGKHFPLISTKTEVEGFYSPPWYYYIMTIPYGLSNGNPIIGILTIALFNSTTAVIMYFFIKDLLKSTQWGIVAAIITALSWEFINYARWLINVSPAYPFVALALFMAWRYHKSFQPRYFFLYSLFAIAAIQFQITLIFQFAILSVMFFILKLAKLPNLKLIFASLVFAIIAFAPLIIFDFRHEHITIRSVVGFLNGSAHNSLIANPKNALITYQDQFLRVAKRTLFNIKNTNLQILFFSTSVFGFLIFLKEKANKKTALFVIAISFMSLGILPFNMGLTQLYQGTGVGLIVLTVVSLYALWNNQKTKIIGLFLAALLMASFVKNISYLQDNDDWFFVPEQKVLTYHDQIDLIRFMNNDAEVKPYKFESFTIPYLHSEGWQYLQEYFYPHQESKLSKVVYIAIEKNIEPFWEKKWIEDLGPTNLVYEKNFGNIRLQKRIVKNPT